MISKIKNTQFWTGVPAWALIGAVVVLLPLFAFMTMASINRQQEKSTQLLLEKGAALIRSFEAGTRTGMMGMHRGGFQLQLLLTETAQQPDIVHLLVADVTGEIIAHNNLKRVGVSYDYDLNLKKISETKTLQWRILDYSDGRRVFEVYRKFTPSERPGGWKHGSGTMRRRMQQFSDGRDRFNRSNDDSAKIIFVGLDMTAIEDAHRADIRHAVIMGLFLLLVGFAGITLLFLFQSHRATRASLSRIKAFSDNVVENMPIGLIALDTRQRIAAFNHTAESLMQLSFHDVMGKAADQILPPELCAQINCPEIQNQVIEKEVDCTVGSSHIVPLEIGASLLADENGTQLGYVILFKDLTEVRALHQEIERSRRLASVGRLAAGVAHEIRNPLSSIKGFATYFKQRYQDVPEDQQTANIMIQEVDRLNRVVSQLLEFARPISVSRKPTSFKDLVADSIKLIQQQAQDKQITINTRNSAKIDGIKIDPDRINQILLNLYLNAIESMDPGGKLQIEISDSKENGKLIIQVSDSGKGIAKEDLPKIFDPYFTTKSSGTGLGLAIAHNIVEAMGGGIEVTSRPGKGTIFRITIPGPDKPKKQISNSKLQIISNDQKPKSQK
ncbi:Sensor protein of zinc sigma-54-dependent two-component system [Olavius sp. associated proteobacterium Delta 1]|nr:Sensor protein of zinc sigma-54-dependent two-component system [Olavius sp. associated proteobacterium Delta 1]